LLVLKSTPKKRGVIAVDSISLKQGREDGSYKERNAIPIKGGGVQRKHGSRKKKTGKKLGVVRFGALNTARLVQEKRSGIKGKFPLDRQR